MRYMGGLKDKFTDANDITHGVWYNDDNSKSIVNLPYQNGYVECYVAFSGSIIQKHISGAGNLTIRMRWGGVWYEHKF